MAKDSELRDVISNMMTVGGDVHHPEPEAAKEIYLCIQKTMNRLMDIINGGQITHSKCYDIIKQHSKWFLYLGGYDNHVKAKQQMKSSGDNAGDATDDEELNELSDDELERPTKKCKLDDGDDTTQCEKSFFDHEDDMVKNFFLKFLSVRTDEMTPDEYIAFESKRQDKFHKSSTKAQFIKLLGIKTKNPKIIELWSYACYQMVLKITLTALHIKKQMDAKTTKDCDDDEQTPLLPEHIHMAYEKMEKNFVGLAFEWLDSDAESIYDVNCSAFPQHENFWLYYSLANV